MYIESCQICNKNVRKDNLKNHMKTHKSKSSPVIQSQNKVSVLCDVCGDWFSQMQDFNQHLKNIHGKLNCIISFAANFKRTFRF